MHISRFLLILGSSLHRQFTFDSRKRVAPDSELPHRFTTQQGDLELFSSLYLLPIWGLFHMFRPPVPYIFSSCFINVLKRIDFYLLPMGMTYN